MTAKRWKAGIRSIVRRLPKIASKTELAPESDRFPVKMRQVLFGLGRKKTHRIVFVVRPEAIVVYAIRHLAQEDLTPDDV